MKVKRYKNFETHTQADCKGKLRKIFFDLKKPIDENFLNFMKVFGYPVESVKGIFAIDRDNDFKMNLPVNKESFQVTFDENHTPDVLNYILWQVHHAVNFDGEHTDLKECPNNAFSIENSIFYLDIKKCDHCLQCI